MSSRRNPGVRINIFFFFVLATFSHWFWSKFSLRLSWAVNKASHTFSASALAAGELCKNCPLGRMLQRRAGRLAPELMAIPSHVTLQPEYSQWTRGAPVQSRPGCCLHPASKGSTPEPGLHGEHISQAAWFSQAILKLLQFWGGDTSIRNPN